MINFLTEIRKYFQFSFEDILYNFQENTNDGYFLSEIEIVRISKEV